MRLPLLAASLLAASASDAGRAAAMGPESPKAARKDSFRLAIDLGVPHRYATRYLAEKRTLQVRVAKAQAKDFEEAYHYDTRYVQRVVVEESLGEVILSLQFKNGPIAWTVFSQEEPWRLVVDVWRTEPADGRGLEEEWAWQEDALPGKREAKVGERAQAPSVASRTPTSGAGSSVIADMPDAAALVPRGGLDARSRTAADAGGASTLISAGALPENFGRIELTRTLPSSALAALQREAGAAAGKPGEGAALRRLAEALYHAGDEREAAGVFRRVAQNDDTGFRGDPDALWMAGESCYLKKDWDLARDYFRSLAMNHASHPRALGAKLRLADIDHLSGIQGGDPQDIPAALQVRYAEISASTEHAWVQAQVAASLRLTAGKADSDPDSAKPHQRNIDACVTSSLVPFELRKNCAYVQSMLAMKHSDAIGSDKALQAFAKASPNDPRIPKLKAMVERGTRSLLEETSKSKDWERWVAFEKAARPEQIAFTMKDPALLRMRAEAFDGAGDAKRSVQLYAMVHKETEDPAERLETAVMVAKRNLEAGHITKANEYLRKVEADPARKANGLTQPALDAVRSLANLPLQNKTSMRILADEMASGRFVERELPALLHYAAMTRGTAKHHKVFEQIRAFPAKTPDESARLEKALFRYAGDLASAGKAEEAGDVYASVAALAQGTKKSEAAYRSGLAYAKAGKLEKAKGAWLQAASDGSDKRYSSLATERLERIK